MHENYRVLGHPAEDAIRTAARPMSIRDRLDDLSSVANELLNIAEALSSRTYDVGEAIKRHTVEPSADGELGRGPVAMPAPATIDERVAHLGAQLARVRTVLDQTHMNMGYLEARL